LGQEIDLDRIDEMIRRYRDQGVEFYATLLELLRASADTRERFDADVARIARRDSAYISILAEVVAARIESLSESTLNLIEVEVKRRPERWRDVLRPYLGTMRSQVPRVASLLEHIGTAEDIAPLRAAVKLNRRRGIDLDAGRTLARRIAPHIFVEDQGRVALRMGDRPVPASKVRKKVLALVCFLVTRPGMAATRDEVIDALWPDTDPAAGVNSLNQTVYFLRRVFEPEYSDDLSANYVHHDSDVVWLDESLISSRTIRCRQVIERLTQAPSDEDVIALSREYRGKFALDFAYEEWATAYREMLHAAYLETMEKAISRWIVAGHGGEAIALLRRALDLDPNAEQLERLLLRAYHATGRTPPSVSNTATTQLF
jgi:DNA-binding SARP family transcriptional activator